MTNCKTSSEPAAGVVRSILPPDVMCAIAMSRTRKVAARLGTNGGHVGPYVQDCRAHSGRQVAFDDIDAGWQALGASAMYYGAD
jgi:hypothetical protein